ncbi:MAG: TetM/TetW/TetO/TetS family tetracycline resistance ribosomal protection protein [Thermomicrobiales bacterium]|nr:TetM/TetW/TetO/TetS family tetracycline resistance ribosomal protection protein [Thermomicrobiales bacterium]
MAIVTIGILAHVDAGKTTLTERILFETGVIAAPGSVDRGTTQTDTLELERTRGITIKAAVAAFHLNDLEINLIDTPGHADFVAEVGRSLCVLDAVVLVVSAVEGVQPQTVKLARAIRVAGCPLILFINKIDRMGARPDAVLTDICRKLQLSVIPLNRAIGVGESDVTVEPVDWSHDVWRRSLVDQLAELDDRVIGEFDRTGGELSDGFLGAALRAQIGSGAVSPLFCGSARSGVGVRGLLNGIEQWLVPIERCDDAPVAARIFKIARTNRGEKLAYARIEAGTLAPRQRITVYRDNGTEAGVQSEERIVAVDRFEAGNTVATNRARAGEIAVVHGLRFARIDDWIGVPVAREDRFERAFPAPSFESIVAPIDPAQANALHTALDQLAEQDPLIGLRVTDDGLSVSVFGDVQKDVLAETLLRDYDVRATFGPSRIICIERVAGSGEAVEIIGSAENPFAAGLGFRVEAGPLGSGIRYERELGSLPPAFYRAIEETVFDWLPQGVHGWQVTDCVVTLHSLAYWSPVTVAADFRKLAPLPLFDALRQARTVVCEPVERLEVELPLDLVAGVVNGLAAARGAIEQIAGDGDLRRIECIIPTDELRIIEQQLPRLTRGEGVWFSAHAGYRPVEGIPPERVRTGPNPLNREHYLGDAARGG